MIAIGEGQTRTLPTAALVHMVAVRYGQLPDDVWQWPYDTLADAIKYLPVTGGTHGR